MSAPPALASSTRTATSPAPSASSSSKKAPTSRSASYSPDLPTDLHGGPALWAGPPFSLPRFPMLRVLIERPPTVDEDVGRSRADYLAVARRHPETARRMRVEFCGTDREREQMLAKAEVFVGWRFPTKNIASRAPHLRWIQLT